LSTVAQRIFSRGEISPALYSRVDTAAYAAGLKTFKNFIVPRFGGAQNRPGTELCEAQTYNLGKIRLIPFVLSEFVSYVLEFGDEYLRFIKDGSYILEATKNITGITIASPGVVTAASHGYSNGDRVYITGVTGMTEINNRYFEVQNVTTNTFSLKSIYDGTAFSTVGMTTYASGGTVARVYTLVSPYAEADLFDIHYTQYQTNMWFVHPDYFFYELTRTSDTNWDLDTIPSPGAATRYGITAVSNLQVDNYGSGTGLMAYGVEAVVRDGGTQVLSLNNAIFDDIPSIETPAELSWTGLSDDVKYNVFKAYGVNSQAFGYIGSTTDTEFRDPGFTPDYSFQPMVRSSSHPTAYTGSVFLSDDPVFLANGFVAGTIGFYQQRLVVAGLTGAPLSVFCSWAGHPLNFFSPQTPRADSPVIFSFASKQYSIVKSILDAGRLILFTNDGEHVVEGDDAGILRADAINIRQFSSYGINNLQPILVENRPIMIQSRGSIFRDLSFALQGNPGNGAGDLSVYSEHLVEDNEIVDWAFQQIPNNILWSVRDDGTLLSLTYIPDQQIIGWGRHELSGDVESVCVLPGSGNYNEVYLVVKRTIDGLIQRHIERFTDRKINDVKDMIFMDSTLSYDGRNTTATTMTISGGTTWDAGETLTLTASAGYFVAGDVGNRIDLTFSDGTEIRFTINAYSSATAVTGMVNKFVPTTARGATANWAKAVDVLDGLYHLEGEAVSVLGDGYVVASPNNPDYDSVTVTDGRVTLDEPYSVIHVGLPVTADMETLDIDIPEGGSIADKKMLVQKVTMDVRQTRGVFVGHELPASGTTGLYELKLRSVSEGYEDPTALKTGKADIIIQSNWNSNGRVVIRQVDPLPVTIGSILPTGTFPQNRG
jgi:hypothetical protein